MSEFTVRISDFRGLAKDAHPAALPPSLFATDEGGDLFERGVWRTRRGQVRLGLPRTANGAAILTLFGFETRVGSLALIVIDANGAFVGYNNLSYTGEPIADIDLEGEGVGPAGEGGYGV